MEGLEFLLEIGTEEIPARFLEPALKQLKEDAVREFKENRLEYDDIRTYGTPRRLVLFANGMVKLQASLKTEVKGPAKKAAFDEDGVPTKAAQGFARSQGVGVQNLTIKSIKGVDYVFATRRESGRMTIDVLSEICVNLIEKMNFPKPMRWGDLDVKFARPIRWLYSSFGNDTVKFNYAGLTSGKRTWGHRFLGGGSYEVGNPAGYFVCMDLNYVLVDPVKRRELIIGQIQELAEKANGQLKDDPGLLDEVTNLVEYPTAFIGSFDEKYLELPPEVLITSMREHQRYFPVFDKNGRLISRFIAVSNSIPKHINKIRVGNERVLQARLADAQFFYHEDLKESPEAKAKELSKVIFLEGLGTVYE
ncbi:MAG TPA: glycine--tRNA ligase subunit beta, partial [Clostridia bacterium]|nr:glycine--tRNA ligase subunit beta [Clostridia bacterium]